MIRAQQPEANTAWPTLRVPGGARALLEAAGLDPATPRAQAVWSLTRSLHAFPPGLEPAYDRRRTSVSAYFKRLMSEPSPGGPDDRVPSPLSEAVWMALLKPPADARGMIAASIINDRRASLLFVGLSATDHATRAFFGTNPALLESILRSPRVAVLAAYGRSLRMRDGRVDPPGGAAAIEVWEDLIGESVSHPDRFLLALLGRDDGRAAALYDAIDQLDESGRAFVLATRVEDTGSRFSRFRALYSASQAAYAGGNPVDRPFTRHLYDAAHVLAMTRFAHNGQPVVPIWRRLWDSAVASDDIPVTPAEEMADVEQGGLIDAAGIVERICVANAAARRERAEMWLFAQRVFAGASNEAAPYMLVTLRGFQRFGALVLTLERMGITDPWVYARMITRARRVADGASASAPTTLALFQGSLAMIERARIGHAIDAETASRLVVTLATLPLTYDGASPGAVAEWIGSLYLSALKPPVVPPDRIDLTDRFLEWHTIRAFAGVTRTLDASAAPIVEIEGLRYRVDPAAADAARWLAVRSAQGGITLDQALAFARAARKMGDATNDLSALAVRLSALIEAAKPLVAHEPRRATAAGVPPRLGRLLEDATASVARIKTQEDLEALPGLSRRLSTAADYFLAEVLVALAYAPHLGDVTSKALLAGDPSPRHDWGLTERIDKDRTRTPWRVPAMSRDAAAGYRVSGALLALDVALGDLVLRRLSTESLPEPPTITANDRAAFTEGVSLANALDYLDSDRDEVMAAMRRGRERVSTLGSNPGGLDRLIDEAGIRDARRSMIRWTLANDPDRLPDFFSSGELFRLGRLPGARIAILDAWGTSGLAREGCLRLMFPVTGEWETLAGRRGKAMVASLMPDLALSVAATLADRHLPAALTKSILGVATQDFVDDVRLAFEDDWVSMFRQVRKTLPSRMDDYIASLTIHGPLVPIK